MARKTYQTKQDLENERKAAEAFAISMYSGCAVKKNPDYYEIDRSVVMRDGTILALVEAKCRKHKYGTYNTLNISAHKVVAMVNYSAIGFKCYLVIQWLDKIGFCMPFALYPKEIGHVWWGRDDRGDSQDMEPCVGISIKDFHLI